MQGTYFVFYPVRKKTILVYSDAQWKPELNFRWEGLNSGFERPQAILNSQDTAPVSLR